jgi:phosphoserine phosphatase RsbU/P
MAKLSAEARYCMLTNDGPADAVTCLNEILVKAGTMDRFVTLTAVALDPTRHSVTVVNAGHMPPLVFRRQGRALENALPQEQTGLPLGILEGGAYEARQVELQPGDAVILYTDGVSDALSIDNRPFTIDGLRTAVLAEAAAAAPSYAPDEIGKRALEAVRRHATGRAQNDDIALVCFGRLDGQQNPEGHATGEHGATDLAVASRAVLSTS